MTFYCYDKAKENFLKEYKKKFGNYDLKEFTNEDNHKVPSHYMIEGEVNIWFIFKKDTLHSFNNLAPKFVEQNPKYLGEGDSINKKRLAMAVNRGCEFIVFAQKEDNYYYADARKLLILCTENEELDRKQDKENTYSDKKGNKIKIREPTYIFPQKYLEVWSWK